MPRDNWGYSEASSYQKSSCTSGGTERISQTKPKLRVRSTGLADNRITATPMPRA